MVVTAQLGMSGCEGCFAMSMAHLTLGIAAHWERSSSYLVPWIRTST